MLYRALRKPRRAFSPLSPWCRVLMPTIPNPQSHARCTHTPCPPRRWPPDPLLERASRP